MSSPFRLHTLIAIVPFHVRETLSDGPEAQKTSFAASSLVEQNVFAAHR